MFGRHFTGSIYWHFAVNHIFTVSRVSANQICIVSGRSALIHRFYTFLSFDVGGGGGEGGETTFCVWILQTCGKNSDVF